MPRLKTPRLKVSIQKHDFIMVYILETCDRNYCCRCKQMPKTNQITYFSSRVRNMYLATMKCNYHGFHIFYDV